MNLSFDPGPSSRSGVGTFLEDDHGHRLLVVDRNSGCLVIVGIVLVAVGAVFQAALFGRFQWWDPLLAVVLGVVGGTLLFARTWTRFDRSRGVIENGVSVLRTHVTERRPLEAYSRVVVRQNDSVSTDADGHTTTTTTFPITLEGGSGTPELSVTRAGLWEYALPTAETLARFLEIPLVDEAVDRTRAHDELDLSLRQQAETASDGQHMPPAVGDRTVVHEHTDQRLVADIPRPDARGFIAITVFVLVLWCIPVGLLSREWFPTLAPLVVVLATTIKCVFGFRSRILVVPDQLRVKTYGLIQRRTAVIPAHELEDLVVRPFESGGPRTTLAHMFDGVIIARSDHESIRFGHGLSSRELAWLRNEIHRIVTSPTRSAPPEVLPQRPSRPVSRWPVVMGWGIGVLAASLLGGGLAAGVALPFLEHLVNVGGAIGALAGLVYLSRKSERMREATVRILLWGVLAVIALDLADLLQFAPRYDETANPIAGNFKQTFLMGWIPLMAIVDLLLAEGAQWLLGLRRRKALNEPR